MTCAICGTLMQPDILKDTYHCSNCGFYSSTFPVAINEGERLDETLREQALKPIRLMNFAQILKQDAKILPPSARILDVGCAHGWFLEASENKGYRAIGIEPDEAMAKAAQSEGHTVITGFFPDDLPSTETFEAITFNDVFEHLHDLPSVLHAVHNHLAEDGIVLLSLPVSDGPIFWLARAAARLGWKGPLCRLWQQGMPSPHLSYFSIATLPRLMKEHGFTLLKDDSLESIVTRGLFARIRYDRNIGIFQAVVIYLAARVIKLGIDLFPSDTHYFIFRKHE